MLVTWPRWLLRPYMVKTLKKSSSEQLKTVDFSETIEACDLKVGRCRQLIELMKVWKVKIISWKMLFSRTGRLISMKARPRYQVSVYRTIGPLVYHIWPTFIWENLLNVLAFAKKVHISCVVTMQLTRAFVFVTFIVQYLYFLDLKFCSLTIFSGCSAQFVADLIRNPKDRFSCDSADMSNITG